MCLTVNKVFKTKKEAKEYAKKPLIAKKDIDVYKILEIVGNYSPWQKFVFEKGFLYYETTNFKINIINQRIYNYNFFVKIEIEKGLHSFIKKSDCLEYRRDHFEDWTKIVKMIVPKGSKYFLGKQGDIVSDKLMWV